MVRMNVRTMDKQGETPLIETCGTQFWGQTLRNPLVLHINRWYSWYSSLDIGPRIQYDFVSILGWNDGTNIGVILNNIRSSHFIPFSSILGSWKKNMGWKWLPNAILSSLIWHHPLICGSPAVGLSAKNSLADSVVDPKKGSLGIKSILRYVGFSTMLKLDFFCNNRLCLADPLLEGQQSSFGSTGTSSSMKGLTSSEKTSRLSMVPQKHYCNLAIRFKTHGFHRKNLVNQSEFSHSQALLTASTILLF